MEFTKSLIEGNLIKRYKRFFVDAKLNDQVVVGLREGSYLQVKGDDIYLKGLKHAVIFKKENEKFEIENGFNLKKII